MCSSSANIWCQDWYACHLILQLIEQMLLDEYYWPDTDKAYLQLSLKPTGLRQRWMIQESNLYCAVYDFNLMLYAELYVRLDRFVCVNGIRHMNSFAKKKKKVHINCLAFNGKECTRKTHYTMCSGINVLRMDFCVLVSHVVSWYSEAALKSFK